MYYYCSYHHQHRHHEDYTTNSLGRSSKYFRGVGDCSMRLTNRIDSRVPGSAHSVSASVATRLRVLT